MKANAYIVSIPKSLTVDNLLDNKSELYTYIDEINVDDILQELQNNIEINIDGDLKRISVLYYIIDYAFENNHLLGNIKIPGKVEKIINVEAKGIKDDTRHHILQHGLYGDIIRRLNV